MGVTQSYISSKKLRTPIPSCEGGLLVRSEQYTNPGLLGINKEHQLIKVVLNNLYGSILIVNNYKFRLANLSAIAVYCQHV